MLLRNKCCFKVSIMSESDNASSQGDPNTDDEQGEQEDSIEQKERADSEDEDIADVDSDEDEEDKLLRDIRAEVDPDIEVVDADIDLDLDELSDLETVEDGTDSELETSDDEEDGFAKLTDQLRQETLQSYHPSLSTGRILGLRSAQIAAGSAPCVDRAGITDPFELARMELKARKVPFIIKRPLPGKESEYWRVSELES